MNRAIKFRVWNFVGNCMHDWNELVEKNKIHLLANQQNAYPVMQFTGLTDKNGVEIYEGDLLNIYFTSSNGEWIHDCIYRALIGNLGDIQFEFVNLLWVDGGKNQYPSSTTLCQRYNSLDYEYKDQQIALKVPDSWQENHFHGKKWKGNDKSFYFEVIGNVHQNPELLESKNG